MYQLFFALKGLLLDLIFEIPGIHLEKISPLALRERPLSYQLMCLNQLSFQLNLEPIPLNDLTLALKFGNLDTPLGKISSLDLKDFCLKQFLQQDNQQFL